MADEALTSPSREELTARLEQVWQERQLRVLDAQERALDAQAGAFVGLMPTLREGWQVVREPSAVDLRVHALAAAARRWQGFEGGDEQVLDSARVFEAYLRGDQPGGDA